MSEFVKNEADRSQFQQNITVYKLLFTNEQDYLTFLHNLYITIHMKIILFFVVISSPLLVL